MACLTASWFPKRHMVGVSGASDPGVMMNEYEIPVRCLLHKEPLRAIDAIEWVTDGRRQMVTVGVLARTREEAVARIEAEGFEVG